MNLIEYIKETLIDLVYPPKCAVCFKYIEDRKDILCEKCSKTILAVETSQEIKLPLKKIWRLTRYREGTREIIRELKFNNKRELINSIKMILKKAIDSSEELRNFLQTIDIATAVPLHSTREKERGFNQVELIFEDWLRDQNVLMIKLLMRVKETHHLFDLSPIERKNELKGAFELFDGVKDQIQGKRILILDDIFTTGSTLIHCAEVLKSNGAGEIYGLVLASDFRYQ